MTWSVWVQYLGPRWIWELRQYLAFGRISHNFYVAADSNPEVLLSLLLQNGEACPVDASGCSFALRSSHQEMWSFFHQSHEAGGSDDDRVSSSQRG